MVEPGVGTVVHGGAGGAFGRDVGGLRGGGDERVGFAWASRTGV